MIPPILFIDYIRQLDTLFQARYPIVENAIPRNEPREEEIRSLLDELQTAPVAHDAHKRTTRLLRLYDEWHALSRLTVHASSDDGTWRTTIESMLTEEFCLNDDGRPLRQLMDAVVQNDFNAWFYTPKPVDSPYDIAYDFLSFYQTYPATSVRRTLPHHPVELGIAREEGEKGDVLCLQVSPTAPHAFISHLNIQLNNVINDSHIFVYGHQSAHPLATPFCAKTKLVEPYAKAVMVALMFEMEYNRGFWGLPSFLLFKRFLEQFVQSFRDGLFH